ncbi:efflux RND transporter periplasmic adaptor subunit [Martelella alba]|uniref:Efflux RND transporter periplasmic adaptor subunit n=1 Tax=Martelella alba TaxID=2590451 RepID=A0A506U020_9HYPH|nr:efflux RND transporter periplasmic adaptor subunit [Martelella alba]TPW27672.1 efflux RND transporter periplasmic adaptor subunit [Martelella alba]
MKTGFGLTLIACLVFLTACNQKEEQAAAPSGNGTEVGYVSLQSTSVPLTVSLHGRVVASAEAEVRPQVDGIVRQILFTEGGTVAEGDALYQIDDRKFKAAYASAEAALKKAQAATASAQSTYDRNEKLSKTEAVSTQTLDDARADLLQAQASEAAAQADLDTAQIDLDNTTILAPLGGSIGASEVSVGALITSEQTDAMATIRKIDTVYVDLVDSSTNFLRIRDRVEAGKLEQRPEGPLPITLTLDDGKTYEKKGEISFADMVVSKTTGTFTMRAKFVNPDNVLIPGMFVTANVDMGLIPGAFLVPQRAVTRDGSGNATVYVVSDDGKAEQRIITTNGTEGNSWIVVDGVENGDRLIVDGFQKFSAGAEVAPVAVTINDDGVVEQDGGSDAAGPSGENDK